MINFWWLDFRICPPKIKFLKLVKWLDNEVNLKGPTSGVASGLLLACDETKIENTERLLKKYSINVIRGVKIHRYQSVTIFNIKDATTSIRRPLYQYKCAINQLMARLESYVSVDGSFATNSADRLSTLVKG